MEKSIINDWELLKGLLHSDGCYYTEKIKNKYTYDRYMFSNKSKDIIEIFKFTCNNLGIKYDEYNSKIISRIRISRKKHVDLIKNNIGTKITPIRNKW